MTRRKRYGDMLPRLYGTQEAAVYLGISRKNLTARLAREQIVTPLAQLACGPIWSESQLDEQLYAWGDNPARTWPEDQTRKFTLSRRLKASERTWQTLVAASMTEKDKRAKVIAVWKDRAQGRSLADLDESRFALAEAKLLRLVADLRDTDPIFGAIGEMLDQASDLRKELEAIEDARAEAVVT